MKNWETYRLGELIFLNKEQVVLDPVRDYKQIKLRLYQKGVELREIKKGSELFSKQYVAKKGQFIISKIDARNGAMGVVPEELNEAVVTGDFLLFDFNEKMLDRHFFNFYTQLPSFIEDCKFCSEGSTNRVRLKVDKLLNLPISIPTLSEQQSIIRRINNITKKIKAIKQLRADQDVECRKLLYSKYINIIKGKPTISMGDVAPIIRRPVDISDGKIYPELGIRSFGKGTFHKPALSGIEIGTKKIFQIKSGDLLFSNVFAWEGAIAVAKEEDNNRFGSHRFISCIADEEKALSEFLCYYFLTPEGLEVINVCSPGGAGRNKTLGLDKLMRIKVPIPSIELQQEFIALLHKVDQANNIRKEQEKELAELLPTLLEKAFKGELLSKASVSKQVVNYVPERRIQSATSIAASNRNDDLELAMIVALMENRLGNSYGEVGIQKTVFNVEAFSPVLNRKYNFVNYHYGTYSAELKEILRSNPFLGKKSIKGNEVFTVSTKIKKDILNAINDLNNKNFILAVNKVLDLYTSPFIGKHTDKIELLNTVTKLIIDLRTIDPNAIYEGMQKWKIKQQGFKTKADKFNLTDTIKTVELLKSNGLIDRLLFKG